MCWWLPAVASPVVADNSGRCVLESSLHLFDCTRDSDCVAVWLAPSSSECCNFGYKIAVNSTKAELYNTTKRCFPIPFCPDYFVDDNRVPICQNNECKMIQPTRIPCGGFVANPHECPPGYECVHTSPIPDLPGKCFKDCTKFQHRNPKTHECESNPKCSTTAQCPAGETCLNATTHLSCQTKIVACECAVEVQIG